MIDSKFMLQMSPGIKWLRVSNAGNATGGLRILVILYALGIVVIGLQPLQDKHGGVFNFISEAAGNLAKSFSMPASRRTRAGEELKVEIPAQPLIKKPVDKLTEKDREELNSLINDL